MSELVLRHRAMNEAGILCMYIYIDRYKYIVHITHIIYLGHPTSDLELLLTFHMTPDSLSKKR